VPVLADESVHSARDVLRVAEAQAADLVNLKLAKCGGLRPARDLIATAHACGLEVVVGCMLEPPATVAVAATLASALPPRRGHDLDGGWWSADHSPLRYVPPCVSVEDIGRREAGERARS
jgi:L-alanine-DL-glutamate epimerase-like enolase superfamily enzyme